MQTVYTQIHLYTCVLSIDLDTTPMVLYLYVLDCGPVIILRDTKIESAREP